MNKKLITSGLTVAGLLLAGTNVHAKLFKMDKAGGTLTFAADKDGKCGGEGHCCDGKKKKEEGKCGEGQCGEGSCGDEKKDEVKK